MSVTGVERQPWEFRFRLWLLFAAYFLAFFLGYLVDGLLGGRGLPAYVVIGRHLGPDGLRVTSSIGALFAIAGFLIRWWASSYHRAGVVMDTALHGDRLTVSGPYRHVRNPLYLGNILQAVAIGGIAPPAGLVFIVLFVAIIVMRLISLEEAYLAHVQGKPYLDYCATVPRLLPRLIGIGGEAVGERPDPALGLLVELGTLGFAVVISYFAIALPGRDDHIFWWLWYASFALLFVGGAMSRRLGRMTSSQRASG